MRLAPFTMIILSFGACHAANTNKTVAESPEGNSLNYVEAVKALPKGQLEAVMFRAIRDAGMDCQFITRFEEVTPVGGLPTWRAQCNGKAEHLIKVAPNGTGTVISPAAP